MKTNINIGKSKFKNPIWVASGTFAKGEEFSAFLDLEEIGAIVAKTVTCKERKGNPPPRVVETPSGLLNSIGLENQGLEAFLKEYKEVKKKTGAEIIPSIAVYDKKEIFFVQERLNRVKEIKIIELNLSCPNVFHKSTRFDLTAQDAEATRKIVSLFKKNVKCDIIAKLTPNVTSISSIARAAEDGGASAVSLVNTYSAIAVDAWGMKPVLGNITGGLSGPAIKPMALKAVWDTYKKVTIPVIGMGGIMKGSDVAEFMLAGASAVQVGTANLVDPAIYGQIKKEFEQYLKKQKITNVKDLVGKINIKQGKA